MDMTSIAVAVQPEAARRIAGTPRGRPRAGLGRRDCSCTRPDCHDRFAALAATTSPRRRAALRNQLVEQHLPLARSIIARYRRSGVGVEDISQVAALAVVEAVDRFDPAQGTAFSAFAVPTICGSIKRYFRDTRWVLQTPRWIKELHLEIRSTSEELTQRLGRPPTVTDLATYLGYDPDDIVQALQADDALHPLSIDAPVRTDVHDGARLAATLGATDDGYAHVEDVETLRPLLAQLPPRELRVVSLRFFGNLTQTQIAERVGCSQMHISRILHTALERLRQAFQNGQPPQRQLEAPEAGATGGRPNPQVRRQPPHRAQHRPAQPAAARTDERVRAARPATVAATLTLPSAPGDPGRRIRRVPAAPSYGVAVAVQGWRDGCPDRRHPRPRQNSRTPSRPTCMATTRPDPTLGARRRSPPRPASRSHSRWFRTGPAGKRAGREDNDG
jgi:RNA polymerase sigma-B factor